MVLRYQNDQKKDKANARKTVSENIEVGQNHINTARFMIMRQGIIDSGIDRKNIFLTTKIQTYNETFQTHLFDLLLI